RPRISPRVALRGRYARGKVESLHRRAPVECCENFGARLRTERDDAAHHSSSSQVFCETSSVNFFENWNLRVAKPRVEVPLRSPIREGIRELANDDACYLRTSGFGIGRVDAIIPDHRRGHDDDLSAIGRIAERLLIAA